METLEIKEITKWVTIDGKEHYSIEAAQRHVGQINQVNKANAVLNSGGSVADALREFSYKSDIDPVLERVNKKTKLVISYWQCRETPGYQPQEFHVNGQLFVYGDAGSHAGSYGNEVTISDLVRYAKDERTIFV